MIKIDRLMFGYDRQTCFQEIDLEFKPGRIYGFLGKNGAGKTTLFKLMSGLLRPQSGDCNVLGYTSSQKNPGMLQDLFFVSESFYLPKVTLKKYVILHAPFYPAFDYPMFNTLLDQFELEKGKMLHTLSYGLKKRFLLAFSLASNCRVLLLDEPTNGLDIPAKRILRKMLISALNKDRTIIIATHQIKEIENTFDSLVFIDQGRILLNSSVERIAQALQCQTVSNPDDVQNCLFKEKVAGGYAVMTENFDEIESSMDIEFLFSAVMNQPPELMKVLQKMQEKGADNGTY